MTMYINLLYKESTIKHLFITYINGFSIYVVSITYATNKELVCHI